MSGALHGIKNASSIFGHSNDFDTIIWKDAVIQEVNSFANISANYSIKDIEWINANKSIILPGYVDSHTHLAFGGSREHEVEWKLQGMSYSEILSSGGGIHSTVKSTRDASLEHLTEITLSFLNTMLSTGTTTVEAKSGYGLTVEDEIKQLKAIKQANERHSTTVIPTFLGAHLVPSEYKDEESAYVELVIEEMLPLVAKKKLATYCDVFCDEGAFTVDQTLSILTRAKELGLGIRVHIDELAHLGLAPHATALGAVSLDHLLVTPENEFEYFKTHDTVANLLPGTPFVLGLEDYAPGKLMHNQGLTIALSSDFNPNCWITSMDIVIGLACYNMKLPPSVAIQASTAGGAKGLELEKEVGRLEKGMKADLQIINLPNIESIPYRFGSQIKRAVVKNGELVHNTLS